MSLTRSSAQVWLIGKGSDTLSSSHLPSNGDALRLMLFYHNDEAQKQTLNNAAYSAVSRCIEMWKRAHIPYQRIDSCVRILMKLYDEYAKLKKNRNRGNDRDKLNQEEFEGRLKNLFDIATSDALTTMKNEEDKQFLVIQRNDVLSCSMAGVDVLLSAKEERKIVRQQRQEKYAEKIKAAACAEVAPEYDLPEMRSNSSSEISSDEEFLVSTPRCCPEKKSQPKRVKLNILEDPEVAGALDRVNLPDRRAAFVVGTVAKALGHNISDMTLSRSSIRRSRNKNREMQASVHQEFINNKPALLLHWDGKLLPDITGGKETVDRIAVLVTSSGEEMLLGVPKIGRGTGKEQAEACLATLDQCSLRQNVVGLVFDTTASNTGLKNGACTFIEQSLGHEVAWVACRHHILELVLASVFRALFGPTGGPDVSLFKRFQQTWSFVDQTKFQVACNDMFDAYTSVVQTQMVKYYTSALSESHPREDYKELIQLCLIFLGGSEAYAVSFRSPGAFHQARWMAKAIYCLKLYLFQDQFTMTTKERKGMTEMALFVSLVYTRFWHEAPRGISAPLNDVQLLEALDKYPNRVVAKAASESFGRHLWYFSEILVGLSFFDDRIEMELKAQMVSNLKTPASDSALKRLENPPSPLSSTCLIHCVSQRTSVIFDVLCRNGQLKAHNFLMKSPEEWLDDPDYNELKNAASLMKVVNDTAERGIALMQQYNSSLTKNEEQKQFLLRLVERHRKTFPSSAKSTLMKMGNTD